MSTKSLSQKLREAAQIRHAREEEERARERTKELRDARSEGYQRGAQGRRELEQMFTHPIAQELIRSAGQELGRAVAKQAEEEGTPGAIAYRVAQEVWSYLQKTGAPLEDTIQMVVMHHLWHMETRMQVHVEAMTLTQAVSDFAFMQQGRRYG